MFQNGCIPECLQGGGVGVSENLYGLGGGFFAFQQVLDHDVIQIVEANPQGLVFVFKSVEIGLVIQTRQTVHAVFRHICGFSLVKTEPLQDFRIVQHFFGVGFTFDEGELPDTPRVGQQLQAKLLRVGAVDFVTRLGALLGPEVGIQAVRQGVVKGPHMPACARGGFEDGYLMAPFHQLVGRG
jgi:hypothetical protein